MTIHVKVYLGDVYPIPLVYMSVFMPVPHCFDYCSFQIGFEIRNYEILNFVVSQDGFNYSKILGYSIRNFRMNISISENERKVLVTQSCPVLCNLMDCSLPGSSVHGILQARMLEWVTIPFSRGSSQCRDGTQTPTLQADSLLSEPPLLPRSWKNA